MDIAKITIKFDQSTPIFWMQRLLEIKAHTSQNNKELETNSLVSKLKFSFFCTCS